jgi:hypothetical protein
MPAHFTDSACPTRSPYKSVHRHFALLRLITLTEFCPLMHLCIVKQHKNIMTTSLTIPSLYSMIALVVTAVVVICIGCLTC